MNNQRGISITELLVATALLGLAITVGFAMINVPNIMKGKALENNKKIEQYRQAFNAFYRVYNQIGTTNANAAAIEALNTTAVPIQFNTSSTALTIAADNSQIEIGGGNSTLNNLLKFRVIAQPTETQSLCKLTSLAVSPATWNYTCPGGSYTGFTDAFSSGQIAELPIVMIDGRICYVIEVNNPVNTVRIDTRRNDCLTPVPASGSTAYSGMFTLPRMVVFSQDKLFSEAIFESFFSPRDRFGLSRYPQN
jgi:hypothetical protein